MKKEWLIAGAMIGCLAGATIGACSSSNSGNSGTAGSATTSTGSTTTAGTGGTTSSSTTGSGGTGGSTTSSTTSSSSSGAGCAKLPGTLHPPKADAGATIYCPFSGVDGGSAAYCTAGTEQCCETPEDAGAPSACEPVNPTGCTGSGYTLWACEDPVSDCPSGMDCCADGTFVNGGMMNGMQCQNYASGMHHTACVAAGSCTGIQICTSNSECPSAHPTCTPFSKAGNQVGACQ